MTAREVGRVGNLDDRRRLKGADRQHVESRLAVVEARIDGVGREDVQSGQSGEQTLAVEVVDAIDIGIQRESDESITRCGFLHRREQRMGVLDQLVGSLMKTRGEQPEPRMLDDEPAGAFRDATLADEDRLPSVRECRADDSPLFQRTTTATQHCIPVATGPVILTDDSRARPLRHRVRQR